MEVSMINYIDVDQDGSYTVTGKRNISKTDKRIDEVKSKISNFTKLH